MAIRRSLLAFSVLASSLLMLADVHGSSARICGDCDGSGIVNVLDAFSGGRHAVQLITLQQDDFFACDVDSSGAVNVLDVFRIAQVAVGIPIALTCSFPLPPVGHWLDRGPSEWGRQLWSGTILTDGRTLPHELQISYPADVDGVGVPVAATGGPFPVIFWEHAGGSQYDWYDYLFSRLASRGFVVVSADHTGSGWESGGDFWLRHLDLFTETIALVRGWNLDPGHYLFGQVDFSRTVLAGHSHGAGAALEAMLLYPPMATPGPIPELSVVAVSLLAPCPDTTVAVGDYGARYRGMPPLQVIYGSKDQDGCVAQGQAVAIHEPGGRPRHYAYVHGASHHGFDEAGLGAATITREEHHQAAAVTIISYLSHVVLGDDCAAAELRGEQPFLAGAPVMQHQWHDEEHLAIDDCEQLVPVGNSVAIAGIPGQTYVNGFLGDTFVDPVAGVALVRAQIEDLLPVAPPTCQEILFYQDFTLGPDVYLPAVQEVVATGLACPLVTTTSSTAFAGLITSQSWDLIVATQQNGSSGDTNPHDTPLQAYICGGGTAILADFRLASATAAASILCAGARFDQQRNFTTMISTSGLFAGQLQMTNPGWGIATYGLSTSVTVFATNEFTGPPVGDPTTSTLGLPVLEMGLLRFEEGVLADSDPTVHHDTGGLEIAWSSPATLRWQLAPPGSGLDASLYSALSLRLLQIQGDPLNPPTGTQDLHLTVEDIGGRLATLLLSDAPQGALRPPPSPAPGIAWKSVFETYRLDLDLFLTREPLLDTSALTWLELSFDVTPTGALMLDDLELATER